MSAENSFNLIDEPWIPVSGSGLVSLRDVFEKEGLPNLGGTPTQKISLLKLLQAIAQSAITPDDLDAWKMLGVAEMSKAVLSYLDQQKSKFWLYGEMPFLQMPAISKAKRQTFGVVMPEIATGNTTILNHSQIERDLTDAERALLLIELSNFAFGGKKTDNSVVLSKTYTGKQNDKGRPSTGKSGPALGYFGYLHSFVFGNSLRETVYLNLFTHDEITNGVNAINELGIPPWESMPETENCVTATKLKETLLGRLVPISRFILLAQDGLHYSEGIYFPNHLEGGADPSITVDWNDKKPKALWCSTDKKPWRELTSILSFLKNHANSRCAQIKSACEKARLVETDFKIWSGGVKVSSNAGEQYLTGSDDLVSSEVSFTSSMLNETWFDQFSLEMEALDKLAKNIYACINAYYKEFEYDGKAIAGRGTQLFWQLTERRLADIINLCGLYNQDDSKRLYRIIANIANKSYDQFCPKETSTQISAWAKCKPRLSWYINRG